MNDESDTAAQEKINELRFATPKVQRTLNLPEELLARMRASVAWLAYEGPETEPQTLADLAASAIAKEVLRLEGTYNDGKPFKRMRRKLRPGRPMDASAET